MDEPDKSLRKVGVYIISDATGITAERVINAVLVQFKASVEPKFERFPQVKTAEEIGAIMAKAQEAGGIVIYSLAADHLRKAIRHAGRTGKVLTIDLLGPLLKRVGALMNAVPALRPGLMDRFGDRSLSLARSIDFTLSHDDGQNLQDLAQADLVILGVSRTSKTPTSLYLSCNHALKVANVPIVQGLDPPPEVFQVACRRVGFIISPARLAFLRRGRFKDQAPPEYVDQRAIALELNHCRRVFQRIPDLEIIDVTNIPIEEVANRIV